MDYERPPNRNPVSRSAWAALLTACLSAVPAAAMERETQDGTRRGNETEAPPLPENPAPAVPADPPPGAEQVRLETELPPMSDWFDSVEDDAPVRGLLENPGEHRAFDARKVMADLGPSIQLPNP